MRSYCALLLLAILFAASNSACVTAASPEASSAITKSRIMAFSASADLVRTRHFYHDVLALDVLEETAMVIVFDVSGTQLRVSKVAQPVIAPYTVLGWQVDHIVAAVARLSAKGIAFERFPGLPQDSSAIATFPNGDRVAWFKDPDGHLLSVTEFGQPSR
jgi:catechol 2,3-dioxygenase-like lactoylglutathione lyase family enzyme